MSDNTSPWEYRALSLGSLWGPPSDPVLEALLNQWGEEGWEVVSVYSGYGTPRVTVVAKRPLTRSERRRRSLPEMA